MNYAADVLKLPHVHKEIKHVTMPKGKGYQRKSINMAGTVLNLLAFNRIKTRHTVKC